VGIACFGNAREAWLRTFLDLPNGIPSHDTLGRLTRQTVRPIADASPAPRAGFRRSHCLLRIRRRWRRAARPRIRQGCTSTSRARFRLAAFHRLRRPGSQLESRRTAACAGRDTALHTKCASCKRPWFRLRDRDCRLLRFSSAKERSPWPLTTSACVIQVRRSGACQLALFDR
jgi:hypothetical protein